MEEKKTFEEYLAELEAIVAKLERQETPLEQAMELFSEGVKIAEKCDGKLKDAQQSVKVLLEKSGRLQAEDFTVRDE